MSGQMHLPGADWAAVVPLPAGVCHGCELNVLEAGEFYMVYDHVWPLDPGGGVLCIGCIEAHIGRQLNPDDFTACWANDAVWGFRSMGRTRP